MHRAFMRWMMAWVLSVMLFGGGYYLLGASHSIKIAEQKSNTTLLKCSWFKSQSADGAKKSAKKVDPSPSTAPSSAPTPPKKAEVSSANPPKKKELSRKIPSKKPTIKKDIIKRGVEKKEHPKKAKPLKRYSKKRHQVDSAKAAVKSRPAHNKKSPKSSAATKTYLIALKREIAKKKRYPPRALMLHHTGAVEALFEIRGGRLKILALQGKEEFWEATKRAIKEAYITKGPPPAGSGALRLKILLRYTQR